MSPRKEGCTINLLADASYHCYLIDEASERARKNREDIDFAQYNIQKTDSEKALVLTPRDETSPIVIAFRGTKTLKDISEDIRISFLGVVSQKRRDAAYKLFLETKQKYPQREIVLTGHSLGGNLATYVGMKAYSESPKYCQDRSVHVRTFNTAPIESTHAKVFQKHPTLERQFVNYRSEHDIVSGLPLPYFGNTFDFKSDKTLLSGGFKATHLMGGLKEDIPQKVLDQYVGKTQDKRAALNEVLEYIYGIKESYQCRIDKQFFAPYRQGTKNLYALETVIPAIYKSVQEGDLDKALSQLNTVQQIVKGKTSNFMVKYLQNRIEAVKKEFPTDDPQKSQASVASNRGP